MHLVGVRSGAVLGDPVFSAPRSNPNPETLNPKL